MGDQAAVNTDRELFREDTGDSAGSYYENYVFVTTDQKIGMGVGGHCIVRPIAEWHKLAERQEPVIDLVDTDPDSVDKPYKSAQNTPPKEQNKDEELRDAILMQFGAHLESGKWSLPPTEVAGNILALFQAHTKTMEREADLAGRIVGMHELEFTLKFEGIPLTKAQRDSKRVYVAQLEAQLDPLRQHQEDKP